MGLALLPFIASLVISVVSGAAPTSPPTLAPCASLSLPEEIRMCERSVSAREYLDKVHPQLITDKDGKVVATEVYVVVWSEKEIPDRIKVKVGLHAGADHRIHVESLDTRYEVERKYGTSPQNLVLRVTLIETKVAHEVIGSKYLEIPTGYGYETSRRLLKRVAKERVSLPYLR